MELKERQDKTIGKMKKQLKLYVKKVEDFEGKPSGVACVDSVYFLDDVNTALIL